MLASGTTFAQWDDTRIAFVSKRDGNGEIYTSSPEGADPLNVTNSLAAESNPSWSPDGVWIAFNSNIGGDDDIYVARADGSQTPEQWTRLTHDASRDLNPAYSPDGARIVFRTERHGAPEIYVMNVDGGGQENVSDDGAPDEFPAWTADSDGLLYTSRRAHPEEQIYVDYEQDGWGNPQPIIVSGSYNTKPAMSRDGMYIAWQSGRDGNNEVYVATYDRNGGMPIIGPHINISADSAQDEAPSWSHDGLGIAFWSDRAGNADIYTMSAQGALLGRVTVHGATDHTPDWSAPIAAPAVAVDVDVRPWSSRNRVNPRSRGIIAIAILGADDFDASSVDGVTIRVGPGAAASRRPTGHLRDVNRDGLVDWVGMFTSRDLGLTAEATSLALEGLTYGGTPIAGSDTVAVVSRRGRRAPALLSASNEITTWAELRR